MPLLASLRDLLDHLRLTGRSGEDCIFGRTPQVAVLSPRRSTTTPRRRWEASGCAPITMHECRHTFASLLIEPATNPKAVQTVRGPLQDPNDLRYLRAPVPGKPRGGASADGQIPRWQETEWRRHRRRTGAPLAHRQNRRSEKSLHPGLEIVKTAPQSRHNRKRPAGEAGRFWGYYREERYVSLYMWIRGR